MADHDAILEKLSDIKSEIATLNTHVEWIRDEHKQVCSDVEDLKKARWMNYGIALAISGIVSLAAAFY